MGIDKATRSGHKDAGDTHGRTDREAQQDTAEQRQDSALEDHRRQPSASETQVRREQGGHDRPVGGDAKPHPRPTPDADTRKKGAVPGRAGGGPAGG